MFVDLTRFFAQSQRVDDVELADTIDAYYEQVGAAGDKRHDVIGKAVNTAARLDGTGVTHALQETHAARELHPPRGSTGEVTA